MGRSLSFVLTHPSRHAALCFASLAPHAGSPGATEGQGPNSSPPARWCGRVWCMRHMLTLLLLILACVVYLVGLLFIGDHLALGLGLWWLCALLCVLARALDRSA